MVNEISPNSKKLMLVDDDTFLLNIYATHFTKIGFSVSQFSNPLVAYEEIKKGFIPDILLLDVVMPGMNGLDLLEKIRTEKLLPETTTIIILTNQSDSAEVNRGHSLGVDGYLIKATSIPSEVADLVVSLEAKHNQNK